MAGVGHLQGAQHAARGPTVGDRYLIGDAPTGAWINHADKIATWNGSAWVFVAPNNGTVVNVEAEGVFYLYNDAYPAGDWVKFSSVVNHNNLSGLQGGQAGERFHLTATEHIDLTGGGNASTQHVHHDQYHTKTELGATSGPTGASLIGTQGKTNLGGATTVEAALSELDARNPRGFITGAGTPYNSVTPDRIGQEYLDTNTSLRYHAIGTNQGDWRLIG